ncbi:response regulator [Siphonobacter sp.]|uniref:response regulator n=1 Tax=Siphonobacter sp. TaxID=1869184 RepID=UPI003B3B9603
MTETSILHILLADDDADDRFLVQEAFDEAGAKVQWESVSTESELLHRLDTKQKLPDLLLLDWNLRPGGGPELLQFIRKHAQACFLPVIVMSTSSVPEDIKNAYRFGANSYIVKPSSYNDLVNTFKSLYEFWGHIVQLPPEH